MARIKNGENKGKRSRAPKKGARGRGGNVVLGPIVVEKIRSPINKAVYTRKESEIAQLEIEVKKTERKISPDKKAIRDARKKIAALTHDLEENTEETEQKVRKEFHFNTNEVRVLRADNKKEIERRTMTAEERTRTTDVEDVVVEPADAQDTADVDLDEASET